MKIAVCIKRVPVMETKFAIAADGTRVDEAGLKYDVNDFDLWAIEAALQLKEKNNNAGEVVVISLGPDTAQEQIRKALAMGADRAVLITDPALHGTDMWATGHVLAQALTKLQYDLVLAGSQSSDAGGGMIYGIIAAELGLTQVTWINEITVANGMVRGKRGSDVGFDIIEAPLPALASVTQTAHEPRYPTLPNIMKAKKKEIATWTLADVGVDAGQVGLGAARTTVTGTERPQTQRQTEVHKAENGAAAAQYIADFLERRKLIARRANREDLREAFLSLTPAGRDIYNDLAPSALEFARKMMETVEPADRAALGRALNKLTERAAQIAADIAKGGNPG